MEDFGSGPVLVVSALLGAMESPMLRAGVAAVQAALAVRTPQKNVKEDGSGESTLTPAKEEMKKVPWLLLLFFWVMGSDDIFCLRLGNMVIQFSGDSCFQAF